MTAKTILLATMKELGPTLPFLKRAATDIEAAATKAEKKTAVKKLTATFKVGDAPAEVKAAVIELLTMLRDSLTGFARVAVTFLIAILPKLIGPIWDRIMAEAATPTPAVSFAASGTPSGQEVADHDMICETWCRAVEDCCDAD